jgi:hypothetical protein
MASFVYNRGALLIQNQTLNFTSADVRVLLTQSGYTADKDHAFVSSVTNEISGTGYSRRALSGRAITEDTANDRILFEASNETWTAIGDGSQTVARAVVYRHVTNDADSPLICVLDLTTPRVLNGGDFTLQFSGGVVFRLNQ